MAPTDDSDTYAVTDDVYGRGGYRSVADTAARDTVTADRRKAGMLVRTNSDGKLWVLGAGLTNFDWSEVVLGTAIPTGPTAAQAIGGHVAITMDANGQATPASADTAEHHAVIGITTGAAASGGEVFFTDHGSIDHLGWTLTVGSPVFLGLSGAITQVLPGSAVFSKVLGVAKTTTRITVDFQPAIFI